MIEKIRKAYLAYLTISTELLASLVGPGEEPDKFDTIKCLNPDPKLSSAAFRYCAAYGGSRLVGAEVTKAVVSPYLVLTALPACKAHLLELMTTLQCLKLTKPKYPCYPVLADQHETIRFFDLVMEALAAWYVMSECHSSIHNGLMCDKLGLDKGIMWGPLYFCPVYYEVDKVRAELNKQMLDKANYLSVVCNTLFFKNWVSCLATSGLPAIPWWWFNGELDNIKKVYFKSMTNNLQYN